MFSDYRASYLIAFFGDDTWISMFPGAFNHNLTHSFDSFNVEDFDTVDNGIIDRVLPLLREKEPSWDVIISHFLGVDHVGHRVGPAHPAMKTKLQHMDNMLRDVVELLDNETLLVVMGDHGMDRRGNHGCDTEHEVTVGVWFHNRHKPFYPSQPLIPADLLPKSVFPDATVPHRSIQQIDIAPSISLLLGLPMPASNLGSIIPELFWQDGSGEQFEHGLRANAAQVHRYVEKYRASIPKGEQDDAWTALDNLWKRAFEHAGSREIKTQPGKSWVQIHKYLDNALAVCRSSWTQFNFDLITLGLCLLGLANVTLWTIWHKLSSIQTAAERDAWTKSILQGTMRAPGAGFLAALLMLLGRPSPLSAVESLQLAIFFTAGFSALYLIFLARPSRAFPLNISAKACLKSIPVLLVLHSASFASVFFVIWEDHLTTFLLLGALPRPILAAFWAPTPRLRLRIFAFAGIFAICVRLMATSTVCREEQHPQCTVTFFTSASLTSPPMVVRLLALPLVVLLPYFIRGLLRTRGNDKALTQPFFSKSFPLILLQGCLAWTMEWIEVSQITPERSVFLRPIRTSLGWSAIVSAFLAFRALLRRKPSRSSTESMASSYLALWCTVFSMIHTLNQLTGQIVLALTMIALTSYIEMTTSIREPRTIAALDARRSPAVASYSGGSKARNSMVPATRFSEVVPLAVLALHTFYATGHQMTISSVQWKTAFALTPTLNLAISPVTLFINECGPLFLLALSAPLLVLWKLKPYSRAPSLEAVALTELLRASLAMMLYHSTLLLSSAFAGAMHRRHSMIWKVFAPRFITAALTVVVVDVASLVALGLGVHTVSSFVP
ncbi:hypothetical protein EIP86_006037 [Pleurotus ostreatoroseus]|nr:hypothetical protein EIP86_006037 [Pleurotus ostreatoroseus]